MINNIKKQIKKSFIKGSALALGLLTTGLLAAVITGTVTTFSAGDVVSSALINENFTSLSTAITNNGTYLNTETLTDKEWIDGSKIYRKVIDIGALPNNTNGYIPHGITNIGTLISATGAATNGAGTHITLPHAHPWGAAVAIEVSNTNVGVSAAQNWTAYNGFVVLEYTK